MLGGSPSWGSAAWATVNPVSVYVTADPPDAKARPGLMRTNPPSHGADGLQERPRSACSTD